MHYLHFINAHYKTLLFGLLLVLMFPDAGIAQVKQNKNAGKINGMSFSGPRTPGLHAGMFEDIKKSFANWVAIVPEATLNRITLTLKPDKENDQWGETIEASIQGIRFAKDAGFKIMLKPHIVLDKPLNRNDHQLLQYSTTSLNNFKPPEDKTRGADWRGTFSAHCEADWLVWESSYQDYILNLAHIADSMQVDLFCIGTELRQSAVKRKDFWLQLIREVKTIYKGPLTYSANWDEYEHIDFWEALDYIGVDAYFPINRSKKPGLKRTLRNWRTIQKKLKRLSEEKDRLILITEFGYRNIYYAGRKPWLHDKGKDESYHKGQLNLYKAFFQAFWDKPWVAGGFSWKWFHTAQAPGNTTFSIQGKPALMVVQKWYGQQ